MPHFQCEQCKNIYEWESADKEFCPNCQQKCTFRDVTNYTDEDLGPGGIDSRLVK